MLSIKVKKKYEMENKGVESNFSSFLLFSSEDMCFFFFPCCPALLKSSPCVLEYKFCLQQSAAAHWFCLLWSQHMIRQLVTHRHVVCLHVTQHLGSSSMWRGHCQSGTSCEAFIWNVVPWRRCQAERTLARMARRKCFLRGECQKVASCSSVVSYRAPPQKPL